MTVSTVRQGFDVYPGYVSPDADALLEHLRTATPWAQPTITLYGRTSPVPRLVGWFGESPYRYSGISTPMLDWTDPLATLRDRLNTELGLALNSCLANLYRSGDDSVGYHQDRERGLGDRPTIATISLGATRAFAIQRVDKSDRASVEVRHGDLLMMHSESQMLWRHGVPRRAKVTGVRVSLTFREFNL